MGKFPRIAAMVRETILNGYFGSSYPIERVAANSVAGGISSTLNGGQFSDGVKRAFFNSAVTYANVQMRQTDRKSVV